VALKELNLANNELGDLPDSFSMLTNLMWLSLRRNKFRQLPLATGFLPQLRTLILNENALFRMLPSWLGEMVSLQALELANLTRLDRLPVRIVQLTNLISLDLTGCSHLELLGRSEPARRIQGQDALRRLFREYKPHFDAQKVVLRAAKEKEGSTLFSLLPRDILRDVVDWWDAIM